MRFLSGGFWHDSAEVTSFFVPPVYNRGMEGKDGSNYLHRRIIFYELGHEQLSALVCRKACGLSGRQSADTAWRFRFRPALLPVAVFFPKKWRTSVFAPADGGGHCSGVSAETWKKPAAAVCCGLGSFVFDGRCGGGIAYADKRADTVRPWADSAAECGALSLADAGLVGRHGVRFAEAGRKVDRIAYPAAAGILYDFCALARQEDGRQSID